MKKTLITVLALSTIALLPAFSAFAAGIDLSNGGLGQVASNPEQFGVAVCNNGDQALTQSVPVSITANGQSATIDSAASIATGDCEYSYVPYAQFTMTANQTYAVQVTIDPDHTVISNSDNATTYDTTVPATTVAPQTADASAQFGNPFFAFLHWIEGLFKNL